MVQFKVDKSFFEEPKRIKIGEEVVLKDALTLFGQFGILSKVKFLHVEATINFLGKFSGCGVFAPHYKIDIMNLSSSPNVRGFVRDLESQFIILPLYQNIEGWDRREQYNQLVDLRDNLVNKLNILDSLEIDLFKWEDIRI